RDFSQCGGWAGSMLGAESDFRQGGSEVGGREFAGSRNSGGRYGIARDGGWIGMRGSGAGGGVGRSDGGIAVRVIVGRGAGEIRARSCRRIRRARAGRGRIPMHLAYAPSAMAGMLTWC